MDGDHTIERCAEISEAALQAVFGELHRQRVVLEGMLLKPNMMLPGKGCPRQASVQEVAEATIRTLRRAVPAAVPGIVFLSGGQSDEDATAHLNAMNASGSHPWPLSFSYGRALQAAAQHAWKGDPDRIAAGQKAFHDRARLNGLARSGRYRPEMEERVA